MTENTTTSQGIPISEPTTTGSEPINMTSASFTFSVEPSSGPLQTPLVLTGPGFGDTPGQLMLNEVPMPAYVWSELAIETLVPYGASSGAGDLVVIRADGRRASVRFRVTEPKSDV